MARPGEANEVEPPTPAAGGTTHEWVSFEDPDEDRTWLFDVTFLMSGWNCIWGHGCQGVLTAPAPELNEGCCSYGAHFTDEEDVERVKAAAAELTDEQWQFAPWGRRAGTVRTMADGTQVTRIAKGACIFLNRPGFAGGAGCALHRAAFERGVPPRELKPDVCWQLPLRREDQTDAAGHVTSTIGQWERRHWGAGGEEFHWWCTEAPEAFRGRRPVYLSMKDELVAMTSEQVYGMLSSYLEARRSGGVPLPHPVVRRR